jgi:hypothetical protein
MPRLPLPPPAPPTPSELQPPRSSPPLPPLFPSLERLALSLASDAVPPLAAFLTDKNGAHATAPPSSLCVLELLLV